MEFDASDWILMSTYCLICYLIGSIPTGYWLAKKLKGVDIRQMGSGSTGATNVYRCVGKGAGISVFIIDFLKGCLPVAFAVYFSYDRIVGVLEYGEYTDKWHFFPICSAMAVLIGHSRSIFLNFKGGKSAATGLGTLFALNFKVGLCTFGTWMVVLYLCKMVSLASILATASCIPYMIFFGGPSSYVAYCILGFIYVTYRHKDNIKRIMAGTESKIGKAADKQ
jgi:acyl phosphate:glycerol-3-phosphate acyltransferase